MKPGLGKRVAKRAGYVLAAVVAAAAVWALYVDRTGVPKYEVRDIPTDLHVEVTPARVERGAKFAKMLCAECHLDPATKTMSGKYMGDGLARFGKVWSKNITKDPEHGIGKWTDGELAYFLRTGLRKDGSYAPPWMPKMPHLSDEDLASIIAFMRSDDPLVSPSTVPSRESELTFFSKALAHTVIKPFPYPKEPKVAPPTTDRVAYGKYLVYALDCYACHTTDPVKIDFANPDRSPNYMAGGNLERDANGEEIRTANLTPDPDTGIGKWSEADFVRALRKGFRPDGRVLHAPMTPRVELTDDEAAMIFAYLRTIPAIKNAVSRPIAAPAQGEPGKKLYVSYGCVGCHGNDGKGKGNADLTGAHAKYPSDAELRDWIDNAPDRKPGTRMPAWKGIIKDEDYDPLMAYVRTLSQADGRSASK
jgi:mono/diheme cytochrome c family protein